MSAPDDHRLREAFEELSRGHMAALETLWRECAEPLHNYAYALTGSQEEADDVLSEVLVRVAGQGRRLGQVRNPRAYLFAAVRNTTRSWARRLRRRAPEPPAAAAPVRDPDVREAVLALPPEQREVVVLHIWGALTLAEIGALTRVSPNTAASRYRYALAKLRESLGDETDGTDRA
jgi:RNA polymerase sigma-70 factor (ECF subfamily)